MNEIKVSVFVTVYNHEQYIEQCLESILKQKCSYSYEIIIHDDCSKDASIEKIKNIIDNYPNIKITLLEEKNNLLLISPYEVFYKMLSIAQGKYIAFCEGDDYWDDSSKMQLQYDRMEKNKGAAICVHRVIIYDEAKHKWKNEVPSKSLIPFTTGKLNKRYVMTRWIEHSTYFASNTFFIRKSIYTESIPQYYQKYIYYDYGNFVHASAHGDIEYIDKCMAVKRVNNPGSLSAYNGAAEIDCEHEKKALDNFSALLIETDKFTQYRYHYVIKYKQLQNLLKAQCLQKKQYVIYREIDRADIPFDKKKMRARLYQHMCFALKKAGMYVPFFHRMSIHLYSKYLLVLVKENVK